MGGEKSKSGYRGVEYQKIRTPGRNKVDQTARSVLKLT
jgi:hypothetical protein